ncbi:hypothetical protein ACG2F4_02210 [Halalkalibaculum sp. DA3122]|uniref:hypothetical protein n=1 Tax=unclassified Halalkalibaculum TaxID=2964617 RepID=UPI0037540293
MSRIPVALTLLAFLLVLPRPVTAQRTFGVVWDVPEDTGEALNQLDDFKDLKITYLELDELVSDALWKEIQQRNFSVFIQVPVQYPVVETFARTDSALAQIYQRFLTHYQGKQVEAIGAFAYGQTHDPSFSEAVKPFTAELSSTLSVPLYYKEWNAVGHPTSTLFDFTLTRVNVDAGFTSSSSPDYRLPASGAYLYHPSPSLASKMAPLKWFFQTTRDTPDAILFFDSGWLLNFVEVHQPVQQILVEHATFQDAVFPLPRERMPSGHSHSIIVLILVLVWGTVALNYSFMPTYRRSLFRFFHSHRFFIEDVIKRHIRSVVPSLLLLIQHSILSGIFLYCAASTFFSRAGLEVFYHYFPTLSLFGNEYFSFFVLGLITAFLFQTVSILWLYFANRSINYLSQISILYSWPFHLNLVITTIIVTMLMAGANAYLLSIFFILFTVVLLLDFPVTAYDAGQNVNSYRGLYAMGTIGLYTLLLAIALSAIFTNSYLLNIMDLAIAIT